MKVLFFAGYGVRDTKGTEGFMKNLGDFLSKKGHSVSILTHKEKRDDKDGKVDELNVFYVPGFPKIRYFLPLYLWRFFLIFCKALYVCIKMKTKIVLVREPESLPFIPLRIFGIKVIIRGCVMSKHFETEIKSHIRNKIIGKFLLHVVRFYQKVVLKSATGLVESSKDEVIKVKEISKRDSKYIPYAVNEKIFRPVEKAESKEILVYHGAFRAIKRIEKLIDLFDKVKEKNPRARLILIGKIREPYTKEKLLEKSKNKESVEFTGEMDKESVAERLRNSKVFVQTALDFGNSPLEAAACGVPVVALGKFEEDFGIFAKNEKDFVREILKLLSDRKYFQKESSKNRSYVKMNRTWERISFEYACFFREYLKK